VLFHQMKKRMKFCVHGCLGSHRGEKVSNRLISAESFVLADVSFPRWP
jgi:hypothetical protein